MSSFQSSVGISVWAWLIVLSLLILAANSFGQSAQQKSTTLWYPYLEWEVKASAPEGVNPFDVLATVVFTHEESGKKVVTEMFYDGQQQWKFRFTGIRPGRWTYQSTSDLNALNGLEGEISVTPNENPKAHGFIKSFGNKWGWQGTEEAFVPQFVMGKEPHYLYNFSSNKVDEAKIAADIAEFIEGHGFTGFTMKVAQSWFDLEHKGPYENPDIRTYQVLENLLTQVHQAGGGACHIWLWGSDGNRNDDDGDGPRGILGEPMNEKDKRNLRYIAARLGPIPGWTMGYGIDTENGVATKEQLDEWKAYLEAHLGWDHFLGARVGYDEKGLWAVNPRPPKPAHDEHYRSEIKDEHTFWLGGDYIGYTSYRPLYDRYVEAISHHPDKPSFEEDRFRLRDSKDWSYKDYSEEFTRRGLWHSALAGGVANIWGNLLPEDDQGGSRPYHIKQQIKTYALFFEDRFLKDMQSQKQGDVLSLQTPDHQYMIFYEEDTDQVKLDLRQIPTQLPAIAVDTKKAYQEIKIRDLSTEDSSWKAPYKSDWAIAVGKF